MNRNRPTLQLSLFPDEFPTWETVPEERQQALQEVLSLLLEQSLQRQPAQNQTSENNHV